MFYVFFYDFSGIFSETFFENDKREVILYNKALTK